MTDFIKKNYSLSYRSIVPEVTTQSKRAVTSPANPGEAENWSLPLVIKKIIANIFKSWRLVMGIEITNAKWQIWPSFVLGVLGFGDLK